MFPPETLFLPRLWSELGGVGRAGWMSRVRGMETR